MILVGRRRLRGVRCARRAMVRGGGRCVSGVCRGRCRVWIAAAGWRSWILIRDGWWCAGSVVRAGWTWIRIRAGSCRRMIFRRWRARRSMGARGVRGRMVGLVGIVGCLAGRGCVVASGAGRVMGRGGFG